MTSQASIARSAELAARVAAAGVPAITPHQFLRHSSAKPQSDASILNLAVVYPKPAVAVRLANAYATEFARYKTEVDLARINDTLRTLQATINSLRAQGRGSSPMYGALVQKLVDPKTMGRLLADNARVLQTADRASSFRPHALRNGILGGTLGALLGVALVVALTGWRSRKSR